MITCLEHNSQLAGGARVESGTRPILTGSLKAATGLLRPQETKKQEIPQDPAQPKGVEHLQLQPLEETRREDLEFKANLGYIVGLCLQKNKLQKNSHRSCLTQALAVRKEIIRQVASWTKSDSEDNNYISNKDLVLPGRD